MHWSHFFLLVPSAVFKTSIKSVPWLITAGLVIETCCTRDSIQLLQELTVVQRITTVIISSLGVILTCYMFFCIIVSGGKRAERVQN